MIVEAILRVVLGVARWVLGLFPEIDVTLPDSWSDAVTEVGGYVASANNVLPVQFVLTCIGIVLVTVGAVFIVRIVRIVLSLFTGGGGGAA